jgi:hypothetical protein
VASTYPLEVMQLKQWLKSAQGLEEQGASRRRSNQRPRPLASIPTRTVFPWLTRMGRTLRLRPDDAVGAHPTLRCHCQRSDLLKLGVEIYSYNDRCSAPFSRAYWLVSITNFTRPREPRLLWNQFHQRPASMTCCGIVSAVRLLSPAMSVTSG